MLSALRCPFIDVRWTFPVVSATTEPACLDLTRGGPAGRPARGLVRSVQARKYAQLGNNRHVQPFSLAFRNTVPIRIFSSFFPTAVKTMRWVSPPGSKKLSFAWSTRESASPPRGLAGAGGTRRGRRKGENGVVFRRATVVDGRQLPKRVSKRVGWYLSYQQIGPSLQRGRAAKRVPAGSPSATCATRRASEDQRGRVFYPGRNRYVLGGSKHSKIRTRQ